MDRAPADRIPPYGFLAPALPAAALVLAGLGIARSGPGGGRPAPQHRHGRIPRRGRRRPAVPAARTRPGGAGPGVPVRRAGPGKRGTGAIPARPGGPGTAAAADRVGPDHSPGGGHAGTPPARARRGVARGDRADRPGVASRRAGADGFPRRCSGSISPDRSRPTGGAATGSRSWRGFRSPAVSATGAACRRKYTTGIVTMSAWRRAKRRRCSNGSAGAARGRWTGCTESWRGGFGSCPGPARRRKSWRRCCSGGT